MRFGFALCQTVAGSSAMLVSRTSSVKAGGATTCTMTTDGLVPCPIACYTVNPFSKRASSGHAQLQCVVDLICFVPRVRHAAPPAPLQLVLR
jgi:hypothetical protein